MSLLSRASRMMHKIRMLLDLSIIPGQFELPTGLFLLTQEAEEPIIVEFHQVIIVHLNGHKVFELLDAMVDLRDLVVIAKDLEDLMSLQVPRVRLASGTLPLFVIVPDLSDLPPYPVSRRNYCHQSIS